MIIGVIPSRWGSTRFPGKSLQPLCGRPLLQWVVERARKASRLDALLVATDDERIARVARAWDVEVVMTSPEHPSGTDRIAEAISGRGATAAVNIQGDEPLIDPALINRLAEAVAADGGPEMATAAARITEGALLAQTGVVKVVMNRAGDALYFSRSVIPHIRDAVPGSALPPDVYWRHIGIYAYRADFLQRLVSQPPCMLEKLEKLEQLRALDMGAKIRVVCVEDYGIGVDEPSDVPLAEQALRKAGLAR